MDMNLTQEQNKNLFLLYALLDTVVSRLSVECALLIELKQLKQIIQKMLYKDRYPASAANIA